jgi:hypothetical protein
VRHAVRRLVRRTGRIPQGYPARLGLAGLMWGRARRGSAARMAQTMGTASNRMR